MIEINTTRYSRVVSAFVASFPEAKAYLDKKEQVTASTAWATNRALRGAIDFALVRDGIELLAFHDGPSNMWASSEALSIVQGLAEEKVLRFRLVGFQSDAARPSLLRRFLGCFWAGKG